jgi:hypothetical protein
VRDPSAMRDEAASAPGGGAAVETPTKGSHEQTSSSPLSDSPASKAPSPRGWLSSVRRPRTSPAPKSSVTKRGLLTEDDARRDSALASLTCSASSDQQATTHNAPSTPTSLRRTPSLPAIVVQNAHLARPASSSSTSPAPDDAQDTFQLDTIIPTGDFDDLTSPNQVSFSKRGSMLLGGKRANKMNKQLGLLAEREPVAEAPTCQEEKEQARAEEPKKEPSAPTPATPPVHLSPRSPSRYSGRSIRGRTVSNRVLSADEMMLSRKVRSMYYHGNESAAEWERVDEEPESSLPNSVLDSSAAGTPANGSSLTVDRHREDSSSFVSSRRGSAVIMKEPQEVAGGIEDWSELEGGEVDRYGFIMPKKTPSSNGDGIDGPDVPRLQRVSTALKLVSEEPRRRAIGRSASRARSARSAKPTSSPPRRRRSQKSSKPSASIFSNGTSRSTPQKSLRQATNILPHNRDRRVLDEASDMLKLPPGLADVAEQQEGGRAAQAMRAKEIEREEKWRAMAKVVQSGANSGGMMFEFDVKDPKVISRTWKGIPDRWRATAWFAFLAASAKKNKDSPTDEELVASFYELQEESSADDMQIDVDVPRTINRHIMFRRRYRGG